MYVLSTGSQFPVQVTSCNFIIIIEINFYSHWRYNYKLFWRLSNFIIIIEIIFIPTDDIIISYFGD